MGVSEIRESILRDFGGNLATRLRVHNKCCKKCPSANGPDPETEDYMKLPIDLRLMTVFPCAWRPNKLCRGYYALMTKAKLNSKGAKDEQV